MSESLMPYDGPLTFRDYWEILRLPVLFALIAIAGTWAVWYLTSIVCTPELAQTAGCNPGLIAQYINLDALNKMVAHAVVGGGGGGIWSYIMITRERRAREAERRAREAAERQLAEERQRKADEERSRLLARIEELERRLNGPGGPGGDGSGSTP